MKPIVQSSTWQSACFEQRTGLLTLQKNKLRVASGACHVWLTMHGKPPTLRLSSEPLGDVVNRTSYYTPQVLFVSFVVR